MSQDSYEFIESPDGTPLMLEDRVAARVMAYIQLMNELRNLKEDNLVTEGLKMLERLRLSINVTPERDVSVMKGGKGN